MKNTTPHECSGASLNIEAPEATAYVNNESFLAPHSDIELIAAPVAEPLPTSSLLTAAENQALAAAGVSEEEARLAIMKANRRGQNNPAAGRESRTDIARRLKEHLHLFKQISPKPLWAARDVGAVMAAHGLHRTVKGWNALGDTLGKHYLHLPCVTISSRQHYDIAYAEQSEADRSTRQEELNAMNPAVLKLLVATPKNITNEPETDNSTI